MASHYLMNNFQTLKSGLHPTLSLQPLPLSLFCYTPIPWLYLTPCRCLNTLYTNFVLSLSIFLAWLIFLFLIQSSILIPLVLTRLSDLLSQIVPLFCSGIATCAYLYSNKLFCHIIIANLMDHLPRMLVSFWKQELLLLSYIPSAWHIIWIRKEFLNWRKTILGIQNIALFASRWH